MKMCTYVGAGPVQRAFLAALLLATAFAGRSVAHHSQAQFDTSKAVALEGTFVEVSWVNPHSTMLFDVVKVDGKEIPVQQWTLETGGPRSVEGLREAVKPGVAATVKGSPNRFAKPQLILRRVILPDGRTFKMTGGGPPVPGEIDPFKD